MVLRGQERLPRAGLLQADSLDEPGRREAAQRINVEADAAADHAGMRAAAAEGRRDYACGLAGIDLDRRLDSRSLMCQPHHVAVLQAMRGGVARRDFQRIAPDLVRERARAFL